MADAKARREAIEQASRQVKTGSPFVRRANATTAPSTPPRPNPPVPKTK